NIGFHVVYLFGINTTTLDICTKFLLTQRNIYCTSYIYLAWLSVCVTAYVHVCDDRSVNMTDTVCHHSECLLGSTSLALCLHKYTRSYTHIQNLPPAKYLQQYIHTCTHTHTHTHTHHIYTHTHKHTHRDHTPHKIYTTIHTHLHTHTHTHTHTLYIYTHTHTHTHQHII